MRSILNLARELAGDLGDDVQRNHAKDKDERQHQDDDGVDLEAGRLVRVQAQHGAAGATGTGGARAVWPGVGDLLLLVGRGPAADGGASTSRGGRRRGPGTRGGARRRAGW